MLKQEKVSKIYKRNIRPILKIMVGTNKSILLTSCLPDPHLTYCTHWNKD